MNSALINIMNQKSKKYDVFISHASEDKDEFVLPLAKALIGLDLKLLRHMEASD